MKVHFSIWHARLDLLSRWGLVMTKQVSLTGYQLKILGIILMVGDHIYEMFIYAQPPTILNMLVELYYRFFYF